MVIMHVWFFGIKGHSGEIAGKNNIRPLFLLTIRPETNSNFVVAKIIFLKDSNFWCVHVNVPWLVCAHAIPFRMLWLP